MACSPEEQKRLTVVPATLAGSPESSAAMRATLLPAAPCGCPQPNTTSLISPGSSPGVRSSSVRMQCAACSSGRVRFSDPRKDLASGVRQLSTMTASLIP